jgi:hypothetical protein
MCEASSEAAIRYLSSLFLLLLSSRPLLLHPLSTPIDNSSIHSLSINHQLTSSSPSSSAPLPLFRNLLDTMAKADTIDLSAGSTASGAMGGGGGGKRPDRNTGGKGDRDSRVYVYFQITQEAWVLRWRK